jgi:hypothetical protein
MTRSWMAVAALLALAACGKSAPADQAAPGAGQPPANIVVTTPDGRAEVRTGGAPGALPGGLPAYPGASATGSIDVSGASAEGSGHVVAFTTPDPPAQVIGFYSQAATAAGYRIAQQMTMGPTQMMTAARAEGDGVTVTATQAGGATQVQIVVGARR